MLVVFATKCLLNILVCPSKILSYFSFMFAVGRMFVSRWFVNVDVLLEVPWVALVSFDAPYLVLC